MHSRASKIIYTLSGPFKQTYITISTPAMNMPQPAIATWALFISIECFDQYNSPILWESPRYPGSHHHYHYYLFFPGFPNGQLCLHVTQVHIIFFSRISYRYSSNHDLAKYSFLDHYTHIQYSLTS